LNPKISIEVVKYRDMPDRQWYMSPHHTGWYYHAERTKPSNELSPQFLEATLDAPLRLLALGLLSLGYTTLPSCSGHYHSEEELEETYEKLVDDSRLIRGPGLELIDVECGDTLIHRDQRWYLPWDKRGFKEASRGSDGIPEGYLGFEVPKRDGYTVGKAVRDATRRVKGTRYEAVKKPHGYVFELRACTGKQRSQDRAWEDLGDAIMSALV